MKNSIHNKLSNALFASKEFIPNYYFDWNWDI